MMRLLTLLTTALTLGAADWPTKHGPAGNGSSPETGLARSWPAEGTAEGLAYPLSAGHGGAVISDNRLIIADHDNEIGGIRCLDASTGKEQWAQWTGTVTNGKYARRLDTRHRR